MIRDSLRGVLLSSKLLPMEGPHPSPGPSVPATRSEPLVHSCLWPGEGLPRSLLRRGPWSPCWLLSAQDLPQLMHPPPGGGPVLGWLVQRHRAPRYHLGPPAVPVLQQSPWGKCLLPHPHPFQLLPECVYVMNELPLERLTLDEDLPHKHHLFILKFISKDEGNVWSAPSAVSCCPGK